MVDTAEVSAALSVLCKGSFARKINVIYKKLINGGKLPDEKDDGMGYKDMKAYFLSVFKMALESHSEVSYQPLYLDLT